MPADACNVKKITIFAADACTGTLTGLDTPGHVPEG